MPDFLTACYTAINVFQFQGVALPSACVPGYPFTPQAAEMALVLFLMVAVVIALLPAKMTSRVPVPLPPFVTRQRTVGVAFALLLLLYPVVSNAVFDTLNCIPATLGLSQYLSLNHDAANNAASSASVTVQLLASNTNFVCYEGAHRPAAGMAWLVLLLYVLGYPIATFLYVRRRIAALRKRPQKLPEAGAVAVPADLSQAQEIKGEPHSVVRRDNTSRAPILRKHGSGSKASPFSTPPATADATSGASAPRVPATPAGANNRYKAKPVAAVSELDSNENVNNDLRLAPFVAADYRPSKGFLTPHETAASPIAWPAGLYWFRHVDLVGNFLLSIILVFWANPSGVPGFAGTSVLDVKLNSLVSHTSPTHRPVAMQARRCARPSSCLHRCTCCWRCGRTQQRTVGSWWCGATPTR